jgi:hypothetical protein
LRDLHCASLIEECEEMLNQIRLKLQVNFIEDNQEIYIPKVKSFLEHCRSTLEYTAQDIFEKCLSPEDQLAKKEGNKNVYFPYSNNKSTFIQSIKRNLPGLKEDSRVYKLVEGLQDYTRRTNKKFLFKMCKITNDVKHNQLSGHDKVSDKSVTVAGAFTVSQGASMKIYGGSVNGLPIDYVEVKNNKIYGNMHPYLIKQTFILDEGTYVFRETDEPVYKFLELCLSEIKQFTSSLYKIMSG